LAFSDYTRNDVYYTLFSLSVNIIISIGVQIQNGFGKTETAKPKRQNRNCFQTV